MNDIEMELGNNTVVDNGDSMKKGFIKKVRGMLEAQKSEIEKRIENNIKNGEIDSGSHEEIDMVQARILALAAKQLAERDQLSIKKIQGAIKRIDEGRYGICSRCEEDIGERRLLINPALCLCIGCAEIREIKMKRGQA